jgi:hypothetical protein
MPVGVRESAGDHELGFFLNELAKADHKPIQPSWFFKANAVKAVQEKYVSWQPEPLPKVYWYDSLSQFCRRSYFLPQPCPITGGHLLKANKDNLRSF